jgi:Na+-translocating ferredoxin:NAD+ oxidoreductase RnfC subunit
MREDVFHTDKAVAIALERLKAKKASKAKLETFEQRAAVASTPEQIAYVENEAMK